MQVRRCRAGRLPAAQGREDREGGDKSTPTRTVHICHGD